MTILDVIVLLLIAGVCGALGQAISGFSRGGCLVSIGAWIHRRSFGNVAGASTGITGALFRSKSAPPASQLSGRSLVQLCLLRWITLR